MPPLPQMDPRFLVTVTLIVLWGGFVCVVAVAWYRREGARHDRIRRWAAHHGWAVTIAPQAVTIAPQVEWAWGLPGGDRRGHGVVLLVSGLVNGHPVAVGEYQSFTWSTDPKLSTRRRPLSTTRRFIYVVTVLQLPTPYSWVTVRSRGALSRLRRRMFGDRETATGHAEFDRWFRVQAEDPAAGRALVGPALVQEHLAGRVPNWSVLGHHLLTWEHSRIDDPATIETYAASLVRVADLFGR